MMSHTHWATGWTGKPVSDAISSWCLARMATGVIRLSSAIRMTRRHRPFSAGTAPRAMWSR
ncbi:MULTISPECIES: hypothetical protein [Bacteroides]|nr:MULTISPECIES: hypothetical protein [Bacteroides]MCS3217422.1 hypothetical protein [Bacteroides thetaiotaomicron]